jgi:hypothetical protein
MELSFSGCIVIHYMTVSTQLILIGDKTFKTYRPAGMYLTRTYPDLGTEAVTEAV